MRHLKKFSAIWCLALLVFVPSHSAGGEGASCAGLHAGITAEVSRGTNEPTVQVGFLLLNDAETTLDVSAETWKLVIDGREFGQSDYLFGNGPTPSGGYNKLKPGATYSFGKALRIAEFFPDRREYKISWKGEDFQSPTITFRSPGLTTTNQ